MEKKYPTQIMRFDADTRHAVISLEEAADILKANEAKALVMDITSPEEAHAWWDDEGFVSSPFTKNPHHSGVIATAVTLGQLQREQKQKLVIKAGEYFSIASKINDDLRRTRFVKFFADALGAAPLTMDGVYPYEFLIATRRIYDPHDEPFNFAPHCDDITYGRDLENWPMRRQYPQQLGMFLTTQSADNDAGFLMWDLRPESRASLDIMHSEYTRCGRISELEDVASFVIRPKPGQLTIFQSKNMHAIERCNSQRRTMGTFLVCQDSDWRFFD